MACVAATLMVTACMALGQTVSPTPIELTLEKAISMALEQNRDVLISDQDRDKADAQISEARSGAFPQLSVSGQYSRNLKKPVLFLPPGGPFNPTKSTQMIEIGSDNSYQGGVSLAQVLYSRKVGVALDIANTYHEMTEQGYQATREDVVLAVKRAFYGVLLTHKLVEANRQGLDVVRANLENVQAQYRNGTAAEFDLLRAQVQLANTEPLLISAENGLLLAENSLKNILAIPLDAPVRLKGEFTFQDISQQAVQEARGKAIQTNPSLAQLALQEELLTENISIESAGYFPTLALFASYSMQTQANTFQFRDYRWAPTSMVGLNISFPLFDGFRTGARVDQARIDREKVRLARLKAEEGLKIAIQSAELRMDEAKKRIAGQEKSIQQAEKAVRIAQTRFKSGVGTQLELMDTQVAMTRTQTQYAQAIYDFLVARAEWERAVGLSQ